ncbi:hypothetical protein LTR05_004478 [Lithohypha guttulata]|uniref:Uncharacterized protein n=1 Tax=Lithohypha guttulata TaxID=1690604 RepID=A0AAN7SZH1_9EURO|nr:hypothetical protein LTR05_004478 [Lithohypha guttulata]
MSDPQDDRLRYESITISGEARVHLGNVYPSHSVIRDGDSHNYPRTDVRGGFVIQGNNYGTVQLPQPEYEKPLLARVRQSHFFEVEAQMSGSWEAQPSETGFTRHPPHFIYMGQSAVERL